MPVRALLPLFAFPLVALPLATLCACGGRTHDDSTADRGGGDGGESDGAASDTGAVTISDAGERDARPDAAPDGRVDAPSAVDAYLDGLQPVAPPGHVACFASGVCDLATQVCCEKADGSDLGTPSCVAGTRCPGPYDAVKACEKQSDCPHPGDVCCASVGLNSNLHAECAPDCGTGMQRCATDGECPAGVACEVHFCAARVPLRVCGHPATWCS